MIIQVEYTITALQSINVPDDEYAEWDDKAESVIVNLDDTPTEILGVEITKMTNKDTGKEIS